MPQTQPLVAGNFGKWLRHLRGATPRTDLGEALRVHAPVPMKVVGSAIQFWEAGRIPPWPVLVAYSRHFAVPLDDIAAKLIAALQTSDGRDLPCHLAVVGSPHAAAPAPDTLDRLAQLTEENARLRADLLRVREAAGQLLAITVAADARAPRRADYTRAPGRGRRRSTDAL